jgi:asparagine synthase (glutamine-hydrolysing)
MCGIAGLLALARRPVEAHVLEAMASALAHRGPDGAGTWLDVDRRVGLAHRRLSIVDLDERAAQPMADAGQRLRISYNGEVYNHRALRRELEAKGARFLTDHSDTEAILQGYLAWGIDGLLQRLEGMYAFALYDLELGRLLLVRDPIGIKPLYFTEHEGQLAFASEIKALLVMPGLPRRVDHGALYHYLSFLTAPAPATMFAGIAKLPAGHLIDIGRDRRPIARRYWNPAAAIARGQSRSRQAWPQEVATVGRLIERAVESQMVADVPVGVFLSGGVDSGTLLALMARKASGPVRAFTVGFSDDTSLNELEEARAAAKRHGAEHHEVLIAEADALACLDQLVHRQDEPLADWVCVPLSFVAGLASSTGTKAVLVGEGADELFHGYAQYQRFLRLADRMARLEDLPTRPAAAAVRALACMVPEGRMGLLGLLDHVHRGLGKRHVFWTGAVAWWELQKRRVLPAGRTGCGGWSAYGLRPPALDERDSFVIIETIRSDLAAFAPDCDETAAMTHAELALRLPELLLMRVDKMTMAHSLEVRVPFLDLALVEHVLGLPRDVLLKGGAPKALMKAAVAHLLPEHTLSSPKRGFGAPMASWLRGGFGKAMAEKVLGSRMLDEAGFDRGVVERLFKAHTEGRRDHSQLIWPIVNLVAWHEHWIEGHRP